MKIKDIYLHLVDGSRHRFVEEDIKNMTPYSALEIFKWHLTNNFNLTEPDFTANYDPKFKM
jgi:hypothetical protein